ncbi:MAG: DUF120 domain-containing protein [Candidatus Aenigmarchaeota archaeon]|nr:DUF120 domain-containing protein [Candidatus Aenigmarchaeota archaeon]
MMIVKGVIFPGVARGETYINIMFDRIRGLIGFTPSPGTMNLKLEQKVDMSMHETKRVEHILLHGKPRIDARLAPVVLHVTKDGEHSYDCWAIRQEKGIYGKDVLEIIAKDNLRQKFGLQDGDTVGVEFKHTGKQKRSIIERGRSVLYPEGRVMR